MKKKHVILWLVTLVVLVGVLAAWKLTERMRYGDRPIYDPARDGELVSFALMDARDSIVFVREGAGWALADGRYPVDSALAARVVKALRALQTRELVTESTDAARLEDLGFGPERVRMMSWTLNSGETRQILLGAPEIPDQDSLSRDYAIAFWKFPDAPKVHRAAYGVLWGPLSADDWRSRTLVPYIRYENIHSVEADWIDSTGRKHHYRLERVSDTAVRMVEPRVTLIPRRNAGHLYPQATQFVADGFIAEMDTGFTPIGLDAPQVVVRIGMKDGRTFAVSAGNVVGQYRYARAEGQPHVVKTFAWRFDYFRKTVEQLLDPNLLPPDSPDDSTEYDELLPEGQPHHHHDGHDH